MKNTVQFDEAAVDQTLDKLFDYGQDILNSDEFLGVQARFAVALRDLYKAIAREFNRGTSRDKIIEAMAATCVNIVGTTTGNDKEINIAVLKLMREYMTNNDTMAKANRIMLKGHRVDESK